MHQRKMGLQMLIEALSSWFDRKIPLLLMNPIRLFYSPPPPGFFLSVRCPFPSTLLSNFPSYRVLSLS